MSNSAGIGQELYDGSAKVGVIATFIAAIIFIILGIAMIIAGIGIVVNHDKTTEIQATIVSINNSPSGQCGVIWNKYTCDLGLKYIWNGQPQTVVLGYGGADVRYVGQVVSVYVKNNDLSTISLNSPTSKNQAVLYIILGAFISIAAWLWYGFTKRNKGIAAMQGAGALLNVYR